MHAAVESDDTRHGGGLTCCPLPATDILLRDSRWTGDNECPEGSIVTGAEMVLHQGKRVQRIQCTAIDTTRYALGERMTGVEWGTGRSAPAYQFGISRSELPLGLQPGLGRTGFNVWDIDGCIAPRPGALQVTAPARRCSATAFRTLERRRSDGTTEPVEMFPRCVELGDMFDPEGGCRVR